MLPARFSGKKNLPALFWQSSICQRFSGKQTLPAIFAKAQLASFLLARDFC